MLERAARPQDPQDAEALVASPAPDTQRTRQQRWETLKLFIQDLKSSPYHPGKKTPPAPALRHSCS